jgi:hypothetical protein
MANVIGVELRALFKNGSLGHASLDCWGPVVVSFKGCALRGWCADGHAGGDGWVGGWVGGGGGGWWVVVVVGGGWWVVVIAGARVKTLKMQFQIGWDSLLKCDHSRQPNPSYSNALTPTQPFLQQRTCARARAH